MKSLRSKTSLSVYSTLTFMLLHLWLNAQTPCPNLVTNGNFEAATSTGFTSDLLVNCGCVLNTHCVTTNFNLKCPSTFPNYGGYPTGTGKFLLAQNSLAANVWETNVTVTPGAPYTFSFWVAQGPFYPVTIAMRVNNVNVNQFTVNQATPLWTQYTYSGVCPAGVTSLPIAIRQISFGEAYSFGIDDVRFVSCVCDCPSGSVAGSNAVINGDFSGGNTGFSNNYTYFAPSPTTFTAIGKYSVLDMTQVFQSNSQWACTGNTTLTPTDAFLIVDGASGTGQTAWQNQVPITTIIGGQYKFCFDANNLVIPARDYADPVLEVWINNVKVAGPFTLPETPDVWVAITASWTAISATAVIEIRATSSEGVGNDFAIDNISFKQCVDLCTTCTGSAASNPSMIANGSFSAGDVGFGSGLTSNPYTASTICQAGYYGVKPSANLYCNIWPTTLLDRLNPGTGQFMAIDGATTGTFPRVLWQNQSPITLSATKNYTFSF